MADTSLIPPTPSQELYTAAGDRPLIEPASDPLSLFGDWLADARASEPSDANAMTLATVDAQGWPDARIVLLKEFGTDGFVFYTNFSSAKGQQIAATGVGALVFHWKSTERQVRLRGRILPASSEAADVYFAERARDSQIGAWASDQSAVLENRETLLARVSLLGELHEEDDTVPRPPHWGGYVLAPSVIEFWQSQAFRLHDRRYYSRDPQTGGWLQGRLYP